jgi:putative ABC transport system permease protein
VVFTDRSGLRQILRRIGATPSFAWMAVLTVAIGVGANTAIFSVVEGILLKALPYPEPQRLVDVGHSAPGVNLQDAGIAPFLYLTYKDHNRTFSEVGLWNSGSSTVTGIGRPEQVDCTYLTFDVLQILGAQPAAGRLFSQRDDSPEGPETVVLSHAYWQKRFGGSQSAVGRRLMIDGKAKEIIGVLPADLQFLDEKPLLFLPQRLDRSKVFLGNFSFQGMARLKTGVTIEQASADVRRMIPLAMRSYPPFPGFDAKMFENVRLGPNLRPLKRAVVGDVDKVLWVLMGTISLLLIIACANVANLMLVRTDARQQELAIRAALGADRGQIAQELLAESVVLALGGGLAGLAIAYGALRVLIALAPANLPRLSAISIDGSVLLFTLGVSVLSGLVFGIVPVLKYAGGNLGATLRAGGRTASDSRERHRARNTLVVVQVSLALVLLIGSGLMIRTFAALRQVDPGFTNPEQVQTLRIEIPETDVKDPARAVRMEQQIKDKLAVIPGVTSVGLTSNVPTEGGGWHDPIFAEDRAYASTKIPPIRLFKFVSPELFKTAGNRLIRGRDFTWADVYDQHRVAIVSEGLARELWHDADRAIGKRIRENQGSPWREVVGVVADELDDGVDQPAPKFVCWPMLMDKFESDQPFVRRGLAYLVRSSRAGSESFLNEVRQAVWSVNPNVPLAQVRTLRQVYQKSLARQTFTLVMMAITGAMALLLGLVGIYGVLSYSVSQRRREIGIRMAVGAQKHEVTRMFLRYGLRLVLLGMACGLGVAFVAMRVMKSLLFAVSPADPLTYAAVCLALIGAAMLASSIPAMRAARLDPVDSLRGE